MEKSNRLEYLDLTRGIGILLVVFGHALIPAFRAQSEIIGGLYTFIYYFHMPLFFAISGMLFENNRQHYTSASRFFSKKLLLLMVPYFVFSLITYIGINVCFYFKPLASVLNGAGYTVSSLKETLLGILFYQNHTDKHLWFVYLLFLTFIINYFTKNHKWISLAVAAAVYAAALIFHLGAYWNLLIYSAFPVYFSIGRFLVNLKPLRNIAFAILLIVFNAGGILCVIMNLTGWYITIPLGIAGTLTVIEISRRLQKAQAVKKFLSFLSEYSYDIYLIHQPFIVSGVCGVLAKLDLLPSAVIIVIAAVSGFCIPVVLSKFLLRKSKLISMLFLGRDHKKG